MMKSSGHQLVNVTQDTFQRMQNIHTLTMTLFSFLYQRSPKKVELPKWHFLIYEW